MANLQNQKLQPATSVDPFAPGEIARRLEAANVVRAGMPLRTLLLLGVLGGLYIGFGGALATLVLTDDTLGYGLGRLAAGIAFSLGLLMLVVAGGELFTGNNLMVLAFAGRKISGARPAAQLGHRVRGQCRRRHPARPWPSTTPGILDGNGVKATAVKIAEGEGSARSCPPPSCAAFCATCWCALPVWLSVAARSVEGKVIAIAFPISAFVALGFEHCIANFYLLTIGMLSGAQVSFIDLIANLVAVTLGNTLGGIAVAGAYYLVYLARRSAAGPGRGNRGCASDEVACERHGGLARPRSHRTG